jgi:hypothetical protein
LAREIPNHLPCRCKASLGKVFNILYKLCLLLWVELLLFNAVRVPGALNASVLPAQS